VRGSVFGHWAADQAEEKNEKTAFDAVAFCETLDAERRSTSGKEAVT